MVVEVMRLERLLYPDASIVVYEFISGNEIAVDNVNATKMTNGHPKRQEVLLKAKNLSGTLVMGRLLKADIISRINIPNLVLMLSIVFIQHPLFRLSTHY